MITAARLIIKVMKPVNLVIKWLMAGLLAAMCVLIGWQIFARFIMGDALDFSEEASRFIMVWLVLLGAAYAAKDHRLIRVDALERFLQNRSRSTVMFAAWIVCILFYLLLIWFGTSVAIGVSYQVAPATEISMSWAISAIPVGAFLLMLNTLYAMSRHILGINLHGDSQDPEADGLQQLGTNKDERREATGSAHERDPENPKCDYRPQKDGDAK